MQNPERLMSREFLALNAIMFLTYCNIAVFFQFYQYLGTLPIPHKSFGLLIALFSVTVLVIRPIISPLLHPANAGRWITISCFCVVASLALYNVALDFWSMALVRLLHGAAYVVLATAVLSKLVGCIPRERSGQAFGLISVITVLPYAVIPPLLEPLSRWAGGFLGVLNLSALVMVLCLPLLYVVRNRAVASSGAAPDRIGWGDLTENLKDRRILILLLLSLVVWTTFTPVFFFLKEYGNQIGVANPGWFLTLSTVAEISVRLPAGPLFDKLDKRLMLAGALGCLSVGFFVMAGVSGRTIFYAMGVWLGLGWGVAMPLLSSLMFDLSLPRFRAMNSNLAMVMFQAGFFVGPLAGGVILIHGDYSTLFRVCGGVLLAGVAAAMLMGSEHSPGRA